ncbi:MULTISPECIES: cytochrome P450 [Streptomyces]|jgi:cytochrome P450|uniref:Cytochrome P450 n=2 Tax=Streptomyces griseoaurantiacus TaxID=68213 RepID=A0A1G7WQ45_9ACTN|nr:MULTISPECIES: cytochrome P450 [Streptomyces]MBA5220041.1 cytochrome P450 [Streptomyces griseoaurantiacus]MCF0085065.1 Cytochrome P450 monooxygenase PikC [Streptomyces sp. MH192]MCF0097542.1 Cytochrome P450 monooxygenase PikC [Streptomyces sp. MH191]MDX3089536.1 cytochrome P450 [Streptomyces sp. ME12-02E]MDX3332978.1 cytochrome P450 [Streptomyces sp. ME02-6978a]
MTDTGNPAAHVPPPGCPAHAEGAVPLGGLAYQQTPSQLYRSLRREHGPVAPVLLDGGIPAWLVLGYSEVGYVTAHDELFARDSRRWNQWPNIPEDWPLLPFVGYQPSVLFTEGEEHQRRAGVISEALEGVDQFELARDCQVIADELIAAFSGSGRTELMAAYVHTLPARAVVQICGMPLGGADTQQLVDDLRISLDAAEGDDPVAAYGRVGARLAQLVKEKRERPGADVTSRMIQHPAGLTDEEIVQDLISVIAAAQQPTANWICNTLRLLLTDERFAINVSGGRLSVGEALNEVLWLDTPTQNFIGRWAVRDTQLGGRQIRAGDCLVLGLAAANTDPQIWPDAHVGAENAAHLSFSNGEHRCPYPAPLLADVMARTAVETLLERLPDLVLAVDPGELEWRPSVWMRGLTALPVEFTPVVQ